MDITGPGGLVLMGTSMVQQMKRLFETNPQSEMWVGKVWWSKEIPTYLDTDLSWDSGAWGQLWGHNKERSVSLWGAVWEKDSKIRAEGKKHDGHAGAEEDRDMGEMDDMRRCSSDSPVWYSNRFI